MKIQDYLHLYIGCPVLYDGDKEGTLIGIHQVVKNSYVPLRIETSYCTLINRGFEFVQPLLRPLSDITKKERAEHDALSGYHRTHYLLSKHFDLFGLIPAGLALPRLLNS